MEGLWEAYGPVGAGILSARRGDSVFLPLDIRAIRIPLRWFNP
jgi:hypothetical protein